MAVDGSQWLAGEQWSPPSLSPPSLPAGVSLVGSSPRVVALTRRGRFCFIVDRRLPPSPLPVRVQSRSAAGTVGRQARTDTTRMEDTGTHDNTPTGAGPAAEHFARGKHTGAALA